MKLMIKYLKEILKTYRDLLKLAYERGGRGGGGESGPTSHLLVSKFWMPN
jgi:hypothetical protein